MLLCKDDHTLIDSDPEKYTTQTLEKHKKAHENRIYLLTGTSPDRKTTILQLKSKIGGYTVSIPASEVSEAVAPLYPSDPRGCVIDLTSIHDGSQNFNQVAKETIERELDRLYAKGMDVQETRHISLFAFATIPLLVFLGSKLSNKIPVDLYQRHREKPYWVWRDNGAPVEYAFRLLRSGGDHSKVALVLSLSGTIHESDLPATIDKNFFIYEITLDKVTPDPRYLRLREDLDNFKKIYRLALSSISRDHDHLKMIHLFPAVPIPVAVACGYELLPKIDPTLTVYDNDKNHPGFKPIIEINKI